MTDTHTCPGPGCTTRLVNRLFACTPHWFSLSAKTRGLISGTARLPVLHPDRRAAFAAARAEWGQS